MLIVKKHFDFIPVRMLDTLTNTVTHYDAETHTEERKIYHSDSVKYHLSFSASKNPNRLRNLVNSGQIIAYLDDLEQKIADAIDRQVEKWKSSDKEYLIAVENGDIQKAARLENCLVYMAREIKSFNGENEIASTTYKYYLDGSDSSKSLKFIHMGSNET